METVSFFTCDETLLYITYRHDDIWIGHLLEDWQWTELSQRSPSTRVQCKRRCICPTRWDEEQREHESQAYHCDLQPQDTTPSRVGHHDARHQRTERRSQNCSSEEEAIRSTTLNLGESILYQHLSCRNVDGLLTGGKYSAMIV